MPLPQHQKPQQLPNHDNSQNPNFKLAFEWFEKERGGRMVNYITINKAARKGLHHEQRVKQKRQ
eukprot:3532171-Ditylum_brightwellii.AAC.1